MKLYNSLTKKVEEFLPHKDEVSIYVCGITPYDTTHLGHAFTYASVDLLIRYLELRGLKVKYVQNVTDIDDDIIKRANKVQTNWRSLGNEWTIRYIRDMQALNIQPPDYYPRATEVIPDIISFVQKILKAGLAYEAGGNVYYSVAADPEFGKLSQLPYTEMLPIANERGNNPYDPNKRNPLDFVLWQTEGVPSGAELSGIEHAWPSPWGPGRPGWHIECSTMATNFLGKTIDIHGGGEDLCFPHHECEIAQVEPVTKKKPFVSYWMHTAMVAHDGEKMSKSLGNLVMIKELLEVYPPDAIRLYLGEHHYREPWTYSEKDLKKAEKKAGKIRDAVQAKDGDGLRLSPDGAWAAFTQHMDNDLDSPGALKIMEGLAVEILEASAARRDISEAQQALRAFSTVFGLRLNRPTADDKVVKGWNEHLKKFKSE